MAPSFLAVALVVAPVLQADPSGFVAWDSSELEERSLALGTRVGPDDSARETLADYGNPSGAHRFRFIRRDGDGRPPPGPDLSGPEGLSTAVHHFDSKRRESSVKS